MNELTDKLNRKECKVKTQGAQSKKRKVRKVRKAQNKRKLEYRIFSSWNEFVEKLNLSN